MNTPPDAGYVDKCIAVLNSVENDNDMFAALFMVTKLTKSAECDGPTRRKIFDAIGFNFISRLLRSEKLPEGCPKNVYRSMALILLSCFATDVNLCIHPHMLSLIPAISDVLLTDLSESEEIESDKQLIDDCYDCLTAISNHWQGRVTMIEKQTLTKLCQVYLNDSYGVATAMKLLVHLVEHVDECPVMWRLNKDICFSFISKLSSDFEQDKGHVKFELCYSLAAVVASLQEMKGNIQSDPWTADIRQGVLDILQSRIGDEQREPALILLSEMIRSFGIEWINQDVKYFILTVSLACIEVRMILEDLGLRQISQKQSTITACYSILEDVIAYLVKEPPICQDEKQFLQVYSIIKEAMSAVIYFLNLMSSADSDEMNMCKRLVQASIRVLCSWLAVETDALKSDVCDVLPFILNLCQESCQNLLGFPGNDDQTQSVTESDEVDLLRFVTPILCHQTAEDESRRIIIQHKGHHLLYLYFIYQWNQFLKNQSRKAGLAEESQGVLTCICGIFMNFAVLEADLVSTDNVFKDLLKFLLSNFSHLAGNSNLLVLMANVLVLGLMLLRKRTAFQSSGTGVKTFFGATISFLKDTHHLTEKGIELTDTCKTYWNEISGLLYIATQELCQILELNIYSSLVDIMYESNWTQDIVTMLIKAKDLRLTVSQDQLSLFEMVLSAIIPLLNDEQKSRSKSEISSVASSYNMKKLLSVLR